jgi:hypothetical protein
MVDPLLSVMDPSGLRKEAEQTAQPCCYEAQRGDG